MGESQLTLFQPNFNRAIHVEAREERLSGDGGALLLRELLGRLGLDTWLSERLRDPRDPARSRHTVDELIRTLVLLQGQGWSDQADVDRLRMDPLLRLAVSSGRGDGPVRDEAGLCSQPTLSRCMGWLAEEANRRVLDEALREWADRRHGLRYRPPLRDVTLDLDSLPVEVHGHQPESAYNGHYRARCYHPVVLHWDRGDFLAARLRPGNAHTADGALEFALPSIRWARQRARSVWLRIDAGFPSPKFLRGVEEAGVRYVARVRTNSALERMAAPYLRRPPGRPPRAGRMWLHELRHRGKRWKRDRRVVLVVLERPGEQGELFLDHFFLLTNAPLAEVSGEELLRRYRGRGRAEKDFGDWKNALQVRLSSSPRPKTHYRGRRLPGNPSGRDSFAVNDAWLLISLLAANLLDLGRALHRSATGEAISRETFRSWVLKTPARVALGSRQVKVIVGADRARAWSNLWSELVRLHPARGSPASQARPLPA